MDWTGTGKILFVILKLKLNLYVAELAVHNATQEQMVII